MQDLKQELKSIYGTKDFLLQEKRYEILGHDFLTFFQKNPSYFFSAPGRSEICGNHTDHNHGKVLAGAINRDIIAAVTPTQTNIITVASNNRAPIKIDLSDLSVKTSEKESSAALIRGVCNFAKEMHYSIGGFDCYTNSTIPDGSGLSSSAAFEVLIGTILNHLYNKGSIDAPVIARIGQKSENEYFGKPCGLMDQLASSYGSFTYIDFASEENPVVQKIPFDFNASRHSLCITSVGSSHADLTEDYANIRANMETVAGFFGKTYLRDVNYEAFLEKIPSLLQKNITTGELTRALHYFTENNRVELAKEALLANHFDTFLNCINQSGESSCFLLRNLFSVKSPSEQQAPFAIGLSKELLLQKGACRIHGGGFGGTIQAFVPNSLLEKYVTQMDFVFGKDNCKVLQIRNQGAILVFKN